MPPVKLTCKVVSNEMITPTVFSFKFMPEPDFQFVAGQFVSIIIPGAGPQGRDLRRAYSIAATPEMRPLELCIKIVEGGPGSNYLRNLKPGSEFSIMAPYGDFVLKRKEGKGAVFISTGTGISPFRSILNSKSFLENPVMPSYNIFGVRTEDELLYADEFLNLEVPVGYVRCVSAPTPSWDGFKGRVTDYLRILPDNFPWKSLDYYLCGNGAMIEEVKNILKEKGIEKDSIHQEVYYRPKPGE